MDEWLNPAPGRARTNTTAWKWDGRNGNNAVWMGSTKAGLRVELKGDDPLWWAGVRRFLCAHGACYHPLLRACRVGSKLRACGGVWWCGVAQTRMHMSTRVVATGTLRLARLADPATVLVQRRAGGDHGPRQRDGRVLLWTPLDGQGAEHLVRCPDPVVHTLSPPLPLPLSASASASASVCLRLCLCSRARARVCVYESCASYALSRAVL